MRVLHIRSPLDSDASAEVARLVAAQAELGHDVVVRDCRDLVSAADVPESEVVHAHGLPAAALATGLQDDRRRPATIVTLHELLGAGTSLPDADGQGLRRADAVTVPSALAANVLEAAGVASVRVIPHAVEATPPLPAADQQLADELVAWRNRGGDVLCAVGHAASGTHHETVLRALTYVPQRDGLFCILAGRLDPAACAAMAVALQVADRVRVCPHLETRPLAARADYVILPGFDERRPFALVEAWCDGVPVLAARGPRFADMDAHGHGTVFFDAGDPLALAHALTTVRGTTPASRRLLVERARAFYRERFSPASVVRAYGEAYDASLGVAARRLARGAPADR